ncbi:MAG: hypothetical protein H7122_15525 [Chitinophagaceae bacterium]|nr:hypothetical protein [Chitinophagaceae bacterium]
MMNKMFFALLFAFFICMTCRKKTVSAELQQQGELIFQSGFENDTVIAKNADADIVGADKKLPGHNDWLKDLDNHPDIGSFNLQYQGGDSTMRFARIIPEPGRAVNHVLQFWLKEPNVRGSKGRIQGNLYGNNGLKEFYQSVRIYLHDDFNAVRTFPKTVHWLTIAEFWNNITWSQTVSYRFRITLGIGKPVATTSDLYFILDAEDCELFPDDSQKYSTVWAETNMNVKVPVGKWFTMEYYYKEGDHRNGRFYMAITPESEQKKIIFDVRKITHNTQDPNPNGVSDFNPLKLYTSRELIEHMKRNGKTLQIYWDDFKLWKNKRPV